MNLQELKARALKNPEVRAEYERLGPEFELANLLITMRREAGLTQDELARLMNTQKGNISRLERGDSNPGWKTIQKYARACGFDISMSFRRHEEMTTG